MAPGPPYNRAMSGVVSDPQLGESRPPPKAAGGEARALRDRFRRFGTDGDPSRMDGLRRLTFRYSAGLIAGMVATVNILNVITDLRALPKVGILPPLIWEGSSWVSLLVFIWIPWVAYRLAPLDARPRSRLLLHLPGALLFSLAHVGGFIALRYLAYWMLGSAYVFGRFVPTFLYEFSKDAVGYALFFATFALIEALLSSRNRGEGGQAPPTFDIRDGGRMDRVWLDEVLAVTAAGNYVEFALLDGRRLLMRSPLQAVESELAPRGFLRTHRSWLINPKHMTALAAQGSGDFMVELGDLRAPLSRRYPEALARLRAVRP
jgi:LytTr DNA-binding domain